MAPHFINCRVVLSGLGAIVPKEVPSGTTLRELLASMEGYSAGSNEQVLVNGSTKPDSYILQDNDSISVAPRNVKAAA